MIKENKQNHLPFIIIGMSNIVLGLTLGSVVTPFLYAFIPAGLIFITIALIAIRRDKKNEK